MSVRLPLLATACGIALIAPAGCGNQPVASSSAPAATTASAEAAATTTATTAATKTATAAVGSCPVSAETLQKASRMPAGWRIDESGIECAQGWAQAGMIAPSPEQQGDGVTLFRFDTSAGEWVETEQGSSIDCAERGIPQAAARKLSVCNRAF
jgi:hypothetical protein